MIIDSACLTRASATADEDMVDMPANITFRSGRTDGVSATFPGGKVKVHGGMYQRGGGHWGSNVNDGSGLRGGDCYRRNDPAADFPCKPSFRIKFSKHSPFNSAFDQLYRFPADKQRCNDPAKFILRGEWFVCTLQSS